MNLTAAQIELFWSKVEKSDDCWLWRGSLTNGYGRFRLHSNTFVRAHRVSYELTTAPIPEGLVLDHLCHTLSDCPGGSPCAHRACVNPDHLEPVTHRENTLRGEGPPAINARRTECCKGHAYTPDNTLISPDGFRKCRKCRARMKSQLVECRACGKLLSRNSIPGHTRHNCPLRAVCQESA